jgi:hypothetical protein
MHFKDIYITYGKKDGKIMFLLRDKMNFLQKIAFNSVEKWTNSILSSFNQSTWRYYTLFKDEGLM